MPEMTKGARIKRGIKVFLLLSLILVILIFIAINWDEVTVNFIFGTVNTRLSPVILVSMLIGAGVAWAAMAIHRMISRRDRR